MSDTLSGSSSCGQRHKRGFACCFGIRCRLWIWWRRVECSYKWASAAASPSARRLSACRSPWRADGLPRWRSISGSGCSIARRGGRRSPRSGGTCSPPAKRLVQLAEALEYHAEQAKLRPFGLAVPETCSVRHWRCSTRPLATRTPSWTSVPPAPRNAWNCSGPAKSGPPSSRCRPDRRRLDGAAGRRLPDGQRQGAAPPGDPAARQGERAFRRIWIQPEDDVPHIRDRLEQTGHRVALVPAQIAVAASLTAAVAATMRPDDFLLCSAAQAHDLGLPGAGLRERPLPAATACPRLTGDDAERVQAGLWTQVARALGAPTDAKERA